MGYTRKRVDGNQSKVVKIMRDGGASVAHTHAIGKGFPDLVIGVPWGLTIIGNCDINKLKARLSKIPGIKVIDNASLLIELKDDSQPISKRKLTEDEQNWHLTWQGQVAIVENEHEALKLMSVNQEHYEKLCAVAKIEKETENV